MSLYRQQALIEAPLQRVWELVGNPERHPEWWPRVIEVRCEGLEEGCTYRQVTKSPGGEIETDIRIERIEDCEEVLVRCLETGTYNRWLLTEAQGDTFVDVEFGMDPMGLRYRVFDVVSGKRYFREWLLQSIDALKEASRTSTSSAPRDAS